MDNYGLWFDHVLMQSLTTECDYAEKKITTVWVLDEMEGGCVHTKPSSRGLVQAT